MLNEDSTTTSLTSTTTEKPIKKRSNGKKQLVSVEQLRQDILKQAGIDTEQLSAYVRDSFAVAHDITLNADDDNTKLKAITTMTQLVQTYVLPKQQSSGTNIQINNEVPYQQPSWATQRTVNKDDTMDIEQG